MGRDLACPSVQDCCLRTDGLVTFRPFAAGDPGVVGRSCHVQVVTEKKMARSRGVSCIQGTSAVETFHLADAGSLFVSAPSSVVALRTVLSASESPGSSLKIQISAPHPGSLEILTSSLNGWDVQTA